MTTTITLLHGNKLDYLAPDPAVIRIGDIAMSLSRTGRFCNQTREFYSVAQHSCLVSNLVYHDHGHGAQVAMIALLHDATEAYMCDLPSDLKSMLPGYKSIEDRLWRCISQRFLGCHHEIPSVVKHCDQIAMVTEARDLMGDPAWARGDEYPRPDTASIQPWGQTDAEEIFLNSFHELNAMLGEETARIA